MDLHFTAVIRIHIAHEVKHAFKFTSSFESQKGVIAVQRCSVENQKGVIAVQSLWQ